MTVRRGVVSKEIEVEAHSYLEVAYKSEGLRGRVIFGFWNCNTLEMGCYEHSLGEQ